MSVEVQKAVTRAPAAMFRELFSGKGGRGLPVVDFDEAISNLLRHDLPLPPKRAAYEAFGMFLIGHLPYQRMAGKSVVGKLGELLSIAVHELPEGDFGADSISGVGHNLRNYAANALGAFAEEADK